MLPILFFLASKFFFKFVLWKWCAHESNKDFSGWKFMKFVFSTTRRSLRFIGLFGSIRRYSLFFSLVRTKKVQSFLFCFLNLVNLTRNTFFAAFRIEINFSIKWNSIKSCQKRQNRIVVSIASIFPSLLKFIWLYHLKMVNLTWNTFSRVEFRVIFMFSTTRRSECDKTTRFRFVGLLNSIDLESKYLLAFYPSMVNLTRNTLFRVEIHVSAKRLLKLILRAGLIACCQ